MVEKVNNRRYSITLDELKVMGAIIERIQEKILKAEYGFYSTNNMTMEEKLALRVLSGMEDWQQLHNKGVRLAGDTHIRLEVYELHELQKAIDKAILEIDW